MRRTRIQSDLEFDVSYNNHKYTKWSTEPSDCSHLNIWDECNNYNDTQSVNKSLSQMHDDYITNMANRLKSESNLIFMNCLGDLMIWEGGGALFGLKWMRIMGILGKCGAYATKWYNHIVVECDVCVMCARLNILLGASDECLPHESLHAVNDIP